MAKQVMNILFSQLQAVNNTGVRGLDDVEPPTGGLGRHFLFSLGNVTTY